MDSKAPLLVGLAYYNGKVVPRDLAKAVRYLHMAAGKGADSAQEKLGFMYAHGRGVEKDYNEAARWLRKATEQGNEIAKKNLEILRNSGAVTICPA